MTDANPFPGEQFIVDASDLRKYRTELPNLYDDADLDVYEFRLLAHYKRVGNCRESLETTAKKCRMSEGRVSQTRQSLAEKGFITLDRVEMGGKRYRYDVRVVDRWIENFAKYSGMDRAQIAEQVGKASPSPHEGHASPHEGSPSPHEGKKELIKNLVVVVNAGEIFKVYEQEFGAITPLVSDMIEDDCKTYPPEWIPEAMQIAVEAGKRDWRYVRGILKNCKQKQVSPLLSRSEKKNGNNNGTGDRNNTKPGRPEAQTPPAYTPDDRAAAERVKKRQSSRLPAV